MLSRRALLTTAPLGAAAAALWMSVRGDVPFVTLTARDTVDVTGVRAPSPVTTTTTGLAPPAASTSGTSTTTASN